jgi:hypothetical protein
MAIVQNVYNDAPAKGFPGQVRNGETSNRISRTCVDAAGIAFGAPVYRSGADGCTGVIVTAGSFLGFAIADHGIQPLPGGVAADIYPQYASVAILTQGVMCVSASGAVALDAAVTIGAGAALADGINDTAADATHIAAPGWEFDEALAAAGLVFIAKR